MKRIILISTLISSTVFADSCKQLPSHSELETALKSVVKTTSGEINGGLELNMWATLVGRDGKVCAIAKTGDNAGDQWPGSRVISAQKANTANAFSLPKLALSTANLWTATQPGGSLFGLQHSNPIDTNIAYRGNSNKYGNKNDPMKGGKIGGVNVFGGGMALYNNKGEIVGGLGISGDTSCADHNVAWKTRSKLRLDFIPGGVSLTKDDNIIYQQGNGFAHVDCGNGEKVIAQKLPESHPISKL